MNLQPTEEHQQAGDRQLLLYMRQRPKMFRLLVTESTAEDREAIARRLRNAGMSVDDLEAARAAGLEV